MSGDLVPETTQQVKQEQGPRYVLPTTESRFQRREREKVTQAVLLERLRYKGYERRKTLAQVLMTIGAGIRSRNGPYFWIFVVMMLWGYIRFSGWVIPR